MFLDKDFITQTEPMLQEAVAQKFNKLKCENLPHWQSSDQIRYVHHCCGWNSIPSGKGGNKNYYVVGNAEFVRSRNTLK